MDYYPCKRLTPYKETVVIRRLFKSLFILLLIGGCAPTKPPASQFYIGMTEKEYKKINPNFKEYRGLKIEGIVCYFDRVGENKNIFKDYFYHFENDTLIKVFRGIPNLVLRKDCLICLFCLNPFIFTNSFM